MSKFLKIAIATLALSLPAMGWAQGKIAVVNLQEAILQTDQAQKRLNDVREQDDYKADKAEFDRLKKEFDGLLQSFQKDAAVMSQEQQGTARQKLATKQSDLEHVTKKLQAAEQNAGQSLLQELSPNSFTGGDVSAVPVEHEDVFEAGAVHARNRVTQQCQPTAGQSAERAAVLHVVFADADVHGRRDENIGRQS